MKSIEDRLQIPLIPINNKQYQFFTASQLLILNGYIRIVVGKRGPYVEATVSQISNIHIPFSEIWRTNSTNAYYIEYRSNCGSAVKIYHQLKTVDYADYQIGFYYISPFDLYLSDGRVLIEPLRKKK